MTTTCIKSEIIRPIYIHLTLFEKLVDKQTCLKQGIYINFIQFYKNNTKSTTYNPQAIKGNFLMELLNLIQPPALCLVVEEVWKHSFTWPNLQYKAHKTCNNKLKLHVHARMENSLSFILSSGANFIKLLKHKISPSMENFAW